MLLGTRVEAVERPTKLVITRKHGGSGGGEGAAERSTVNCGLVMWAAGTGPASLTGEG